MTVQTVLRIADQSETALKLAELCQQCGILDGGARGFSVRRAGDAPYDERDAAEKHRKDTGKHKQASGEQ